LERTTGVTLKLTQVPPGSGSTLARATPDFGRVRQVTRLSFHLLPVARTVNLWALLFLTYTCSVAEEMGWATTGTLNRTMVAWEGFLSALIVDRVPKLRRGWLLSTYVSAAALTVTVDTVADAGRVDLIATPTPSRARIPSPIAKYVRDLPVRIWVS
jgi:hypothetical protein